jgi:hypothetical protein
VSLSFGGSIKVTLYFSIFSRIANFYFLLMVVLQFIPSLEVTDPSFAAIPIVVIVAATAMKGWDFFYMVS